MAEQKGFDEQRVAKIGASFDESDLCERDKVVLRYADCFLTHASSIADGLKAEMLSQFSDAEIVEITAALSLFLGFSKIAIALGPIPEGLPVMHLPLPDLPAQA